MAARNQLVNETNSRHKHYLQRTKFSKKLVKATMWKPKKRHRTSVLAALKNLDRQFKFGTGFGGLQFIIEKPNDIRWSSDNWRLWPGALCVADQGSDMFSAMHCMTRHFRANLLMVWDWAHGAQRDLTLCFQHHGLFKYALIFLVCINVYSGPEQSEGLRFEQLIDAMKFYFDTFEYNTSVLFECRAEAILLELGDAVQQREDEKNIYESLWRFLREAVDNYKKHERIKMAQWMGWVNRARQLWREWEQEHFKREFIAIECGMLDEKAACAIEALPKGVKSHALSLTTTSTAATQADTKLLRSSTVNNLAMSVCFMESSRNKRIIAMMVFYPEGLSKWQGEAAKMCRSVEANMEWLLGQMVDSFSQPYREILGSLESPIVTRQCGFMEISDGPDNDAFGFMSMEDEFAELAGHISLGIVSRRRRRLLYMTNMWPHRSVLLLGPADLADTVAAELEYDHKVFLRMESMSGPSPVLVAQLRRSAFQCVPTRQLVEGFKSSEWACSDAIKSLIRERWSGVHSSIIIEELNNIQKTRGRRRGRRSFDDRSGASQPPSARQ